MSWTKQQTSALVIIAYTSFLNPFLVSSVNIALPTIEKTFGMNAVSLSWVITAFLLSSAMLMLPFGKWADIVGIKKIYRIGVYIFTFTTFLCGMAPNGWFLIVSRFLQGIGGAMTMCTSSAILVSLFEPQQRGRVLGISVAAVYLGLAFGPFLGGILTEQLSWRYVFFIPSFLGLFSSFLVFRFLGDDQKNGLDKKIELKGSMVYATALVTMIIGSSSIPSVTGWILLITGFLLLFVFFFLESRSHFPVIDTKLFTKNKLFAFSNLAALINYSATYAIVFILSLYLQTIKGYSPQDAGFILLAQPVIMAIFSPIFGRLSDKVEPRYLATAGMALCSVGLAFLAFLNQNTPINAIIGILVVVGIGFSLFSSPNTNTIMSSVERHQYGQASGISATMRIVGQMVSMTIVTFFISLFLGSTQLVDVPIDTFIRCTSVTFTVFASLCAVGIWFSYSRGNLNREKKSPVNTD